MNINDMVSVKLTSYGLDVFLKEDTGGSYYKYNYIPETATLTVPLWTLIELFGSFIYHGCKQLFENNEITIEE